MATSLLDQTTAARVSVIVRSAHDVTVNVSFEAEPRWESKMRWQWQHAQSRNAPTPPRTHEVVVSPAEGGGESPTVATKTANGVNREYDDREEPGIAESCSLVMESLDKRLSQIAHPDHGLEPPGPHLETRRHGLDGSQRQHSRVLGQLRWNVGGFRRKSSEKCGGHDLHEDNLVAKTREDEGGHAQKARPEPEDPKLRGRGGPTGGPRMWDCRSDGQTSPATWTMPVPPEAHEAPATRIW